MSSPFAARLGTNYCPKDEEIVQIKSFLVEPSLRLKRLDEEIIDLQKAINKLAAERDELGTFVEGHKALISPVRRLPLDIVQEIFVACIPTHRNCVMSASEAPVLLGRICSSWRAIAFFTPRLWARLHIVGPPRGGHGLTTESINKKVAQRLAVTEMWLGRSGQCPLSISLQSSLNGSPPVTPSTSDPSFGQFLQALISFAPRWQHIRFAFTNPSSILEDMVHLNATDVPMLKSISFRMHQRFPFLPVNWELLEMLRSPSISSFSVSGNIFIREKTPIHWHQLTDLTIDGLAWHSSTTSELVLQTLSRCPNLRSCKLAINDGGIIDPQLPHSVVELGFLHTLELDFGGAVSTVPRFLEQISLPKMHTFTLHGYADLQSAFSLAPFFGFGTRLESLSIDSNTFSKPTLLSSLGSLPSSLRQLSILDIFRGGGSELWSFDDDALAVLATSGAALETVIIKYCSAISDEALLKFIVTKMAQECRLKRVEIQFSREMVLDILPSLQPFVETGLDISLTYIPPQTTSTPFSPWQGLADDPGEPNW